MPERHGEEALAATALHELVAAHGSEALADPVTVRSLLNDHLGADATGLRREVKLLAEAAAEGIPDLLRRPTTVGASATEAAVQRLAELGFDAGAAQFAVATWAGAMGIAVPPSAAAVADATPTVVRTLVLTDPAAGTGGTAASHPALPIAAPAGRMKLLLALGTTAAVIAAGIGVAVAQPWSGDDPEPVTSTFVEPAAAATGAPAPTPTPPAPPDAADLQESFPGTVVFGGLLLRSENRDDITIGTDVCGDYSPRGGSEASVTYDAKRSPGFVLVQALGFATTVDAEAYFDGFAAHVACTRYREGKLTYTVRDRLLGADGTTLEFSAGSQSDPPDELWRVVRVERVVLLVRYFEAGIETRTAADDLDTITESISNRIDVLTE